ncbi:MAG: PilZ domain-containing protein [Candidatus Omnitrophica bacterium]|nr:PilZ domain-containing protein [Candidatus Omnitrophota bacterium]
MAPRWEEKRRFPRTKLTSTLRYQLRGSSEYNSAASENVSEGGMAFINNRFIPSQTSLMLEINVLSKVLTPIGKISWSSYIPHTDRYRMGVEFLEMDPKDKEYLSDFIDMQLETV